MECTKVNCPMQAGTSTDNCGENCPWRTMAKTGDLISRAAAIDVFMGKPPDFYHTSYIVGEINCLPSVDAIPVAWLNQKYAENEPGEDKDYDFFLWDAIQYILTEWQKEQEAR